MNESGQVNFGSMIFHNLPPFIKGNLTDLGPQIVQFFELGFIRRLRRIDRNPKPQLPPRKGQPKRKIAGASGENTLAQLLRVQRQKSICSASYFKGARRLLAFEFEIYFGGARMFELHQW